MDPSRRRPVVPAHVRARAARSRLVEPRRRRGVPVDPAVLARQGRRRLPHRRRSRHGQEPDRAIPRLSARSRSTGSCATRSSTIRCGTATRCTTSSGSGGGILDEYSPPRIGVAEAWVMPGRRARYVRPDELHQAFNFDFLQAPWDCAALVDVIETSLREAGGVGATATWVLSNHDVVRHLSRYALPAHD